MIRDYFKPYIDGQGLMAPQPNPGFIGSDNGTMFLSEYMIILHKHMELTSDDINYYHAKIKSCMNEDGILNRYALPNVSDQEGPDNYLGVLHGCKSLGIFDLPRAILTAVFTRLGFLNNVNPGVKTAESFLIRQPQLLAAMVAASFPKWTIGHFLMRLLFFPFFLWSALVILVSCMNEPISNTDVRRLGWHLVNITSDVSLLCWLASKVWYNRLFDDYPNGMSDVAAIYYYPQHNNPFMKYWLN